MGRYLSGSNGFSYKYIHAQQPDNLMALAVKSGAGSSVVVPTFEAPIDEEERNLSINCIALARDIVAATGAQGEISRIVKYPTDAVPVHYADESTLEFVQYAMAEQIVEVLKRIDAQLPHPVTHLFLVGTAGYMLEEKEHAQLLKWVNTFLPEKLKVTKKALANSKEAVDEEWREVLKALWGVEDFVPFMAFQIVHHALVNSLSRMTVKETGPGIEAEGFWSLVPEWGPPIFGSQWPSAPDALFARALVQLFSGNQKDAIESLKACKAAGGQYAQRYLLKLKKLKHG